MNVEKHFVLLFLFYGENGKRPVAAHSVRHGMHRLSECRMQDAECKMKGRGERGRQGAVSTAGV